MTRGRGPAAAGALACALAAAGCGLGPGEDAGDVKLTVTSDYGSRPLRAVRREISESETVMRLLDRGAEISTRYGGGFVQSIDGIEGGTSDGRPHDWFFYVNGVESSVGAADYRLEDGYSVWWDYRDWGAAMRVPAVVGSFPEPFRHGYEGERHPVSIRCPSAGRACDVVRDRLGPLARSGEGEPIRILVGAWSGLRSDDTASLLERGPQHSGVFADFIRRRSTWLLQPLDAQGRPAGPARKAGLVAATREEDDPPTWLVTGSDAAATAAAARLLDRSELRNSYAVAAPAQGPIPLPVR